VKKLFRHAKVLLATGLGTGYSPKGPGTAGSILAVVFFYYSPFDRFLILPFLMALAWAGCEAGRRMWGHDPSRVTIDEVAGCWIACLAVPVSWGVPGLAAAFLLFRVFDIVKPWPVSRFDRIDSGLGILLDDVAAGLMAAVLIRAASLLAG
jgi:phosphatidylglycerophosphatase A